MDATDGCEVESEAQHTMQTSFHSMLSVTPPELRYLTEFRMPGVVSLLC